ncbi:hypothetical protein [Pseudochrobactrum kiredjianiae]|uniref:Uncharacterized protein n=1 Tax=Pseudochrobactrum kiredjianiae TaxID=386305 RepID=A0ABW3V442_9HYPH|nr:hypothetical protein [Pseudochrobactrum kiredjianiae]MDM7851837.1 hypothetical protein [Pseudochrobactrum kiredjianiae]
MKTTPSDHDKQCEACGESISESTPHYVVQDYCLCETCALTYQNMIDTPGCFINNNNEEMTAEEAHEFVSEHLQMGGELSDKVLNFGITLQ